MAKELTSMYKEDAAVSKTHPGMAHFAGTGPDRKSCRECSLWMPSGYFAKSNKQHGPTLKLGGCRKYKELMKKELKKVPHTAAACRWFDENEKPLPIREGSI